MSPDDRLGRRAVATARATGIFGGTKVFFVAMLAVLMVVIEGVRWRRVSGEVAELESRLAKLAAEGSSTGRDGALSAPEAL